VLNRLSGLADAQIKRVVGDRQRDTGFSQSSVHAKAWTATIVRTVRGWMRREEEGSPPSRCRSESYFAAAYNRRSRIDQAGASGSDEVCVMRTNLALTGANRITVVPGTPSPSATGALHDAPSPEICT
jgi:hypothetical protein